jgi:glycosyltransferase involved in cell wall biosynthesis
MAAGLPVVATDVGGTREAVVEGETGFLVPPGDPNAIADRVMRLLASPAMARSMGEKGLARARERFSVQAMVSRYQALYSRHVAGTAL